MKNKTKKSGETLIEALVSITVLMMASSIASSMIISSIQQTSLSEVHLVAQNLAAEAVEGIKNIRDTNKILYPNIPECWMVLDPDPEESEESCSVLPEAEIGWYIINYGEATNPTNYWRWYMDDEQSPPQEIEETSSPYHLYLKDQGGAEKYTHLDIVDPLTDKPSKYYRAINITEMDGTNSYIAFDVEVYWYSSGQKNIFTLKNVIITKY